MTELSTLVSNTTNGSSMDEFESFSTFCYQELKYDLTELGNAKRLGDLVSGKVHWVAGLGKFIVYKNGRWIVDVDSALVRLWDLLLDSIKSDIKFYTDLKSRTKDFSAKYNVDAIEAALTIKIKDLKNHYKASQSKNTIFASQELYKAQKGTTVRLEELDSKGHYIGCKNGVLDLRNGILIENDPSYLMMKSTGISFDPSATCPMFMAFLNDVTSGDNDKLSFLHQFCGQMLRGEPDKSLMAFLLGDGANGKSVLVDTVSAILGDYAESTNPDVLTGNNSRQEYYIAQLQGKRLVTMVETQRGDKLDENMVKSLINSGRVTARLPYGEPFSFQPAFSMVLSTNYLPYISNDPAVWRRLVIIPFDYTIPEQQRDPGFREKLVKNEAAGIFNWMLEGAIKVAKQGGITIPASLMKTRDKYRRDFDNLAHFIEESESEVHSYAGTAGLKCRITALRAMYEQWCKENGYHALNTRNFKVELCKKGYEVKKSTGGHDYLYGIGIAEEGKVKSLILDSYHLPDMPGGDDSVGRFLSIKLAFLQSYQHEKLTHEELLTEENMLYSSSEDAQL